MPEHAQRRAPVPEPEKAADAKELAFEELRHMIVSPEQEQIVEIRSRIESPERRIEDVSAVVAEAIQMRRERGDAAALSQALAPTVQETLRESVQKDPHVLADALFPVMGPAIRRSITETLRSMIESFNEALEHSISVQGIQWRIEALRTGKPFAEIVLMHSLVFRVEQVFLIHRETGLPLEHVTAPAVATQDPSMVAGMLSAIQQFVRDSFASQGESLDSMTVGGLEVWIDEGPHAAIAAVIRGHAPADYRIALKECLEAIERAFGAAFDDFRGDTSPFRAADAPLQALLITQHRERRGTIRKPRMVIGGSALVVAIIAGWISYVTYDVHRWTNFARSLGAHPGIVVTSFEKSGGRWHIHGFRDPLAIEPADELIRNGLDARDIDFELAPFYSLDDVIVTQRAEKLLAPPSGVNLSEGRGTLSVTGTAPSAWMAKFRDRAFMVPGVTLIDASSLRDSEIVSLEATVLTFPVGGAQLEPGQQEATARVESDLKAILEYAGETNQQAAFSIIGHTDSTGIEGPNQLLSNQRAAAVASTLIRRGIPKSTLTVRGVGTSEPLRPEDTEEGRQLNRSVTFRVNLSPVSATP